jgi:DNA-binding transcriptional ArsR family regulator
MDDVLEISTPAHFKALAHPLRHRILFALSQRPATISQLAPALGERKGTIAHHVGVLREAGMVRVGETRQVRGGTEQYYERTARRLSASGPEATGHTGAMFAAVAAEIDNAEGDPLVMLRHVRLNQEQADRLAATLEELSDGAVDAGDGQPQYGIVVSLYQQAYRP